MSNEQSSNSRIVLLNGEVVPYGEASIHVEDRGLQFGESIYEVLACYNRKPFRLQAHLARLATSADAIGLELPHPNKLIEDFTKAIHATGMTDGTIYLQVTGGVTPRTHVPRSAPQPEIIIVAQGGLPDVAQLGRTGVRCMTVPDDRWARCYIKTTCLLSNVLARKKAIANGFDDALFVRDDLLMEGPSNNVFLVRDDELYTPPANNYILKGITRSVVIELADLLSINVREEPIPLHSVGGAQEAFITSTVMNIRPVIKIDSFTLAAPVPGPVTQRLQDSYCDLIKDESMRE